MTDRQKSDDLSREEQFLSLFLSQEIDAVELMIKNHKVLVVDLPQIVLEFFKNSLGSLPKASGGEIGRSELVCCLILGRIMQDIRSMSVCASLSYATAVASVAASIFEIAFELMYLANNDEAIEKWIKHDVIQKKFPDMDVSIGDYVEKLGYIGKEKTEWKQKYFEPYRLISMAKHGNSMLQQNLGLKSDKASGRNVIVAGPDGSPESMAIIALSLEHSLPVATAALARFFQEYYPNLAGEVVSKSDEIGIKLTLIGIQYPKFQF